MKKLMIIICCFTAFCFTSLSQIAQSVKANMHDLRIEKENGYDKILLKNAQYTDVAGQPELPVYIESFVVPADAIVTGVKIKNVIKQKLDGTFHINPVQEKIPASSDAIVQDSNHLDIVAYDSLLVYPGKYAEVLFDRYDYGFHIVTIRLFPIEYIPKAKEVYLCDIDYEIEYSVNSLKTQSFEMPLKPVQASELAKKHIQYIVNNKNEVDAYAPFSKDAHTKSQYFSSDLLSFSSESYCPKYIIITTDSLKPTFQILANWKTKKGVLAHIETVETISSNFEGCDLQEKIRNYLKSVYVRWGSGLFVLLGGDTNIIPARMVIGDPEENSSVKPLRASDLYYATIEGSWNANNNNIFREDDDLVNYGYAFYLGRAPVENSTEAQIFISKIISYEKASGISDQSYYNNILIADAFMLRCPDLDFRSNVAKSQLVSYKNTYMPSSVNAWFMFDDFDCTGQKYYYSGVSNCCKDGLYSVGCPGGNCTMGNEEFSRNNFLSALNTGGNSGSNRFHIIYHMDHSGESGMGTSSKDKGESVTREDFDNLSNGIYSQILISGGCKPASFDKDCIGEKYLNNANGGGVVFIGNADYGYTSEYVQFRNFLNAIYATPGYPSLGRYDIGAAFHATTGSSSSYRRRLTLLGDPEMQVWTNTPQTLQDSIFPQTITTGESTVTVTIGNLPAGEEAVICLQKENEVYEVKTVTQNGSYPIVVTPRTAGTMDVTVTAHNFIPRESVIQVNAGQLPSLFIEDIVVKDDRTGNSIGNNNGKIEAGEKIELSIKLKNGGLSTANTVSATLTSLCSDITVNTAQSSYGNIASGAINGSLTKYVFTVDKGAIERMKNDPNPALFQLTITDSGSRTYTDVFKVDLFAPEISQRNKIESTTNGDKTIQAGETVWIQIELTNTGGADATGLTAVLSTTSPYVTSCSSTPRTYPVIKKNETKASTTAFEFKVSSAYTSTALPLNFTLLVQNEFGKTWTYNFNVANRLSAIPAGSIKSVAYLNEIELYWTHQTGAVGYNIYRSDVNTEGNPVGNYIKTNNQPVVSAYFRDYGLSQLTKYIYKISAVSSSGSESELSPAFLAWTSYPTKGLFPIAMNGESLFSKAAPVIASDIDCDGNKEIFATFTTGDSGIGLIEAVRHDGTELFDIDNNVTTYAGFARYDVTINASVAIGDLYGTGESYCISATRNFYGDRSNYVTCHSMYDKDGDNKPDVVWQYTTPYSILTSPILANLDNSSDGSLEVVLRPDANAGVAPIIILDSNGNELYRFGESSPYSSLAVADMDNDGDLEIIAGYDGGVYIWHHDGRDFAVNNPIFKPNVSTHYFHSSPTICDIDGDGENEILISSIRRSSASLVQSIIYAINSNGTLVDGWDGTQVSSVKSSTSSQGIVVGDLNRDGDLEVVVVGADHIRIWNKNGSLLNSIAFNGAPGQLRYPVLADVDEADDVEIVFYSSIEPKVYALKMDGSSALGFPLDIKTASTSTLCVADVDNNGRNEVIVSGGNQIYMWETAGNPELIEWGMGRSNPHSTGEYKSYCEPVIINSNTIWSGNKDICGNLIIHSGTLTLDANATLTMQPSTIVIIKAGATLVVDGGKILNANIKALPGSNIILKNNGLVKLSKKGEFSVFEGAVFDYQYGNIDITTD